jgi:uncharacterized protein
VVEAALTGEVDLVVSWELVDELARALERPRLARYGLQADDVRALLESIARALPSVEVAVEIRDPADAQFVEAALAGRADAIVTGDADLLENIELRRWLDGRGVRIVTPRELVDELG